MAIIGAGPAGLMLARLLHLHGIESVVIEHRSESYVVDRVRAGVLEQTSVDLLRMAGVGDRLDREGLRHSGVFIAFDGQRHRIDLAELTGGRAITIYGQNEVVKDLIAARTADGQPLLFDASDVTVSDIESEPAVRFRHGGRQVDVHCDFVAGCDGAHGICRPLVSSEGVQVFERAYPFGWLGVLVEAPPTSAELVYSRHDRGFALFSMRSPDITRLYLQCRPDDRPEAWSDDRIWDELHTRLGTRDGWSPARGRIVQKSVTGMRSAVVEPMQRGRLFLAGDAAHIVPPTGAKGLNLALADVWRLAAALDSFHRTGSEAKLREYTERGLRRTWRAQRFSWWMTSMLHRSENDSPFDQRRQLAELEYLVSSRAAMTSLAENYVGAPLE